MNRKRCKARIGWSRSGDCAGRLDAIRCVCVCVWVCDWTSTGISPKCAISTRSTMVHGRVKRQADRARGSRGTIPAIKWQESNFTSKAVEQVVQKCLHRTSSRTTTNKPHYQRGRGKNRENGGSIWTRFQISWTDERLSCVRHTQTHDQVRIRIGYDVGTATRVRWSFTLAKGKTKTLMKRKKKSKWN